MRTHLAILTLAFSGTLAGAQTLDLGSMGGPALGDRSIFVTRASYYEREAERLYAMSSGWDASADEVELEQDLEIAIRARATMHALCARTLVGENARHAAEDHRMVIGKLIAEAMVPFEARVQGFEEAALRVHTRDADAIDLTVYARRRAALIAFVTRCEEVLGTQREPYPMGFTIRSLDNALRPAFAELVPLLDDAERALLMTAWDRAGVSPGVRALRDGVGDPDAAKASWDALERLERSTTHTSEARRLARLARDAHAALGTLVLVEASLQETGARVYTDSMDALLSATGGGDAEGRLHHLIAMGDVLAMLGDLRVGTERTSLEALDGLAQDAVRAALTAPSNMPGGNDPLVRALEVCERALRIARDRRTLAEPERMTGHTRRAWLLMHSEQSDREAALIDDLRDLVAKPSRVTSPALVSSIARARTGYERLLAIRMSDDWLDELREDGRLAVLLGPTVNQRSRDLLIFTLRERIRDAADKDVRERALDDLNALRERAERLGRSPIEDGFAESLPQWMGEGLGERLAEGLARARASWVQAWIDEDTDARTRWAERLSILVRARDLVVLAERLDDASLAERSASIPSVLWPKRVGEPLRDRVRGLASGALRTALDDDPSTTDDDTDVRARLTLFEDRCASAEALESLAALGARTSDPIDDDFVRLLAVVGVLAPLDHPARRYRHDIASYVRWVHELHSARNSGDREAIVSHLDEVGADVSARLSGD